MNQVEKNQAIDLAQGEALHKLVRQFDLKGWQFYGFHGQDEVSPSFTVPVDTETDNIEKIQQAFEEIGWIVQLEEGVLAAALDVENEAALQAILERREQEKNERADSLRKALAILAKDREENS